MFGMLRLVLEAMVALSHLGVTLDGLWIGVIAVVIFYMISGYAMTGLLQSRFPREIDAPVFYIERIVRLVPQYYLWLAIALFSSLFLKIYPYEINTQGFYPYGIFSYLMVWPLGLQRYIGSVNALILPQATTLGIEITFYMLSPWILKNKIFSWGCALIGLSIFIGTAFSFLPENIYTYYTSPGPIVFYLLGSFVYQKKWIQMGILAIVLLIILVIGLPQRFNLEFMVGLITGLPLLIVLARFPSNNIDSAFGDASYGCFLAHGIVFFAMSNWFHMPISEFTASLRIAAIVLSCLVGWISFYGVERPTIPFRRRIKLGDRLTSMSCFLRILGFKTANTLSKN